MNNDLVHRNLQLRGPLVISGANETRILIAEALEQASSVRLDVSETTDIDISFLQTLIAAHKTAKLEQKMLTVTASGSERLAAEIARCGLPTSVLPDFRDVFPS